MKEIVFIAIEDYDGDEVAFTVHSLHDQLLFSVSFSENNHLLINFYKEHVNLMLGSSICSLDLSLSSTYEYPNDIIVEAVEYVDDSSMYDAASRITMDYIASCIMQDEYISSVALGKYVKENFDKHIQYCIDRFSYTEDGRRMIESHRNDNERD